MKARERSITESSEVHKFRDGKDALYKHERSNALHHEALRLKVVRKLESIEGLFKKNQKQLSNYFVKYQPLSESKINVRRIIDERFEEIRLIKTTNKIYFGGYRNKQRQGEGILIDDVGKIYEGNFTQNLKIGHGVEIYPNGNIYIGQFATNKKHGNGQFFWFSLSYPTNKAASYVEFYEGTWWGGLPDGKGFHQKSSGDQYEGDFKNGLKHGQGQQYFQNGDHYIGQYVNGLPEGTGIYSWSDGSRYKGEFKQGLRSGQGTWVSEATKQEYSGEYVLDKKCGYGEYSWADKGYLYKGYFENDLRHGYGELFTKGQLEYKGGWVGGVSQADMNKSVRSKRTNSAKGSIRTPKSQKFPTLSRLKPPSYSNQFNSRSTLKQSGIISRSRSPTSQFQSLSKIGRPNTFNHSMKKLTSVKQKLPKKRPVSYNKKPVKRQVANVESLPKYELIVRRCKKTGCGCNAHLQSKTFKSKKRLLNHLNTEPMCF